MTSKSRPTSSKLNSFFKFRISSKEATLHETLRLDSAKPSDPIDANEIVQQLVPGANTLQSRLRTLEELSGIILSYPFQHVSELWIAVEDLLEAGVPHNARKAAWNFMVACIRGQFEDLGMLRAIFYQVINNHEIWEDFDDKLQALKELTNNGRDVYGFEKNIVRLLAHWIASSYEQAKVSQHISQQRLGMQKSTTSLASLSSAPHVILLQKPIPHFDTTIALLINVVKFNFVFFDELEIANLLDLLHTICINAPEDTAHIVGFLDVIVRYGYVPAEGLSTFLKILCHTTLSDTYHEQAWMITLNLMKSHSAHNAIRLLCLNLRSKGESVSSPAQIRIIQGSIRLLQRSVWGSTPIDTLSVSFSTILWSLKSAVDFKSKDVNQDIVIGLSALLEKHADDLRDLEYEIIMDIMENLKESITEKDTGESLLTKPFIFGPGGQTTTVGHQPHPSNAFRDVYGGLLYQLIGLYNHKKIQGVTSRLMALLASLQDHLPEDTMLLLLDYYYTEHHFYPYTPDWLERLHDLVQISVIHDKRPRVRSKALQIALDVYDASFDFFHDAIVTAVFLDVFSQMDTETDSTIAAQISDLLIRATGSASDDLLTKLFERIVQNICCSCHFPKQSSSSNTQSSFVSRLGMTSSSSTNTHQHHQPTGVTISCQSLPSTLGIIDLFQYALYDPNGASRVDMFFSQIVKLATNQDVQKASRLVLLDFLLCLRVDLDHRIFCSTPSTIESITTATEQLLNEDTRQDRTDRSGHLSGHARSSGLGPAVQSISAARQQISSSTAQPTQNWKQLMQGRTIQSSPYVISYLEIASTTSDNPTSESLPAPLVGCAKVILNIPLYMDGILKILENERNFEVYSFVIQRLPSQLFNKHLFCNSIELITKLQNMLVDMTLRDKFPDSLRNLPLSAKRHNIHILAYKVLVILLCYNNKFSTGELHDLVHAFVVGLQRQATCAKICIHALVVCCYELPQSMTKHLPGTVLKLSQIMSTATISVHILEFLSTVAKLPMLYSNFTENDYKRVFGIALKYIQYTHSVAGNSAPTITPSTTSSAASSPASPAVAAQNQSSAGARALPQYVLIMAYHVIDVWFMLQRLTERRKYVPYIVRNLLMANEPGKRVDEQTETCMDMLARYSYANCEPKPKPSLIHQILMSSPNKTGKIVTKTWLQGNAFITVRTAQNVGWAEITIRRASGTVSFLLKIENDMFMSGSDELEFTSLPGLLRHQEDVLSIDTVNQPTRALTTAGSMSLNSEHTLAPSAESDNRREEAQHLAVVSGLSQRLSEARPSWLSPRSTPQHTPLHTPRHTPHHTPKASPLPSGDNTPSSSPPSRSYLNAVPSKLFFEGGHHRVQTAPTGQVNVFSSSSLHPLQASGAPTHSQDDGSGDVDVKDNHIATPLAELSHISSETPMFASASMSNSTVVGSLGRSKSASDHSDSAQKTGVKHAEFSRGTQGSALEQTKSLLSHSVGKREDIRRSVSLASSRNNSITTAMGRAQRFALAQDDHRLSENGVRHHDRETTSDIGRSFSKARTETSVDPSFLFMQLTSHPDMLAREVPILLADDDATNRALGVLDRIPVVDFHKIGVVYVGKGQSKESEILGNTHGSFEYTKFLAGLGSLVRLKNAKIYAGGLDLEMDLDGEYAYSYQDEITQMIFHVATMMPNYPHDVNFDSKKRHIGNDWVTIVFNESGTDYDFGTISGQFNFMTLVVTPVSMASVTFTEAASRVSQQQQQPHKVTSDLTEASADNRDGDGVATVPLLPTAPTPTSMGVTAQPFKNVWFNVVMLRRPDMPEIGPLATPKIISATELPRFTRQMALHANIYAQVYYQHLQNSVEYVSNWQERLRQIKRVKDRLIANAASNGGQGSAAGSGQSVGGSGATGASAGGSNHGGSRPGGGPNGNMIGSNNNSNSGNAGGGNSSSIGLGLSLGLGLGSSGANGASNQGSSSVSQGQQQNHNSIMNLEPVVDFTRYS
ncbi:Tuberous sclerosis 2-like protein [Linnemannia zychae]|nr:Tuberous sclerosis 2-like protein [Linnemannia zychae]